LDNNIVVYSIRVYWLFSCFDQWHDGSLLIEVESCPT